MAEMQAFKAQMAEAVMSIRNKSKPFSVPEIRRLLLRAVSVLVHSPHVSKNDPEQAIRSALTATRWTAISCTTSLSCPLWLSLRLLSPLVPTLGHGSFGKDRRRKSRSSVRYAEAGSGRSVRRRVCSVLP